jgi:hypothetical protein
MVVNHKLMGITQIRKLMGLGTTQISFGRKFRWAFVGYNSRGVELFNSFVKVTSRVHPDSNKIQFIKSCFMYDKKEEAKMKMDIANIKFAIPRIEYGTLTLFDGTAVELERFEFDCIEAKIISSDQLIDGVEFIVDLEYESVIHVPLVEFPLPK